MSRKAVTLGQGSIYLRKWLVVVQLHRRRSAAAGIVQNKESRRGPRIPTPPAGKAGLR